MDSTAYAEDIQLVIRVWDCDNDAFEELVVKYQNPLFYLIRGWVSNPEDAEDCAQDALVKVYIAMKETRKPDDPGKFWPYLRTTAYHVAMDKLSELARDRARIGELTERLSIRYDPSIHMDLSVDLQEMVEKLPKWERIVIKMHYFEGYGVDEIAGILSHSQSWVSKRKKRGEELLIRMWRRSK